MMRLTQSQRLLWAGQKRDPDSPIYNMALAFTIEGPLDVPRFVRANEQLCQVCETFRTVIDESHGEANRKVLEEATAPLEIVDLSANPEAAKDWLDQRAKRLLTIDRSLTDQVLLTLSEDKHIWFLNQHHLITDGATSGLVFDTLQKLYRGEAVDLPSFDDYALFEAENTKARARTYWDEKLASSQPASVTLYGKSLVAESVASERVVVPLGKERTAKLRELALSPKFRGFTEDLSMFQFLASVVFAFLHRQTGETHLGIATPTHNRPTPAFKRTAGVFIEVFPLEIQLGEGSSFLDILQAVRNEVLTYLTHAQGGQSRPELAARTQILLNVVGASFGAFDGMPTKTEWLHSGCGDRQHALRLAVYDFDNSSDYSFLFDFNHEAFGPCERQWAIDHLFRLIDAILEAPSQALSEVDLLGSEARETVLSTWNQTQVPFNDQVTVIDQFEEQRWENPDRVALSGPCAFDGSNGTMTYEALDQRANQLANHLADTGIGKGNHVAILLEPSLEWVVSMLAVLKAGAAYFPVSTEEPSERLAWLVEDTDSKLVITRSALADRLPEAVEQVLLDVEESAIGSAPDVPPPRSLSPENRFYLISTSGSTGKPKAVCGRHVSVVNLLEDFAKRSPLLEETATTWWTSPTFDVSIYEIWSALYHGRTLHIIPQPDRPDTERVLAFLESENIQVAYLPAYMLPDLAGGKRTLPSLRRLLVGVEPIQESLLGEILREHPDLTIINGYGPAEATICCTLHRVGRESASEGIIPIGRPVQNTTVHVLDAHRQPVPVGAPGELYVGGVCLAEGYWNRPALNSTRFVPNPFANEELYRTGDRVRYLPNGDLQFLGRVDEQLKVRGHRIEPGEVIAALESHSAVRQAALRVWSPSRLVAYISVIETTETTETHTIREYLETKLPRYMVPSQVVVLESLPKNINGKVDTSSLPEPERNTAEGLASSETEVALAKIWAQVFGLDEVGVDENFFDLGGDSILSIRIVAQAHQSGIRLTTPQVFEHQTIAVLAKAARPAQDLAHSEQRVFGPVPQNAIQHWFFSQDLAHLEVFNHQLVLESAIDRATMESRLNRTLSRHDAFRLTFEDGQPTLADSAPSLTLTEMPSIEAASTALNEPFQLKEAPLVRAAWIAPNTLVLVAHHLIVDGVSWAVLADELEQEGAPIHSAASFGAWCQSLDKAARTGSFRDEAAYWRAQDTTDVTPLPLDFSTSENQEASRSVISTSLPAKEFAKADASVQDILLTAVASAITAWTQQTHVRIDLEGHGREAELLDLDLTSSIGWFTSLFPLNLTLQMRESPASRLKTVSQRLRSLPRGGAAYGVLAYQDPQSGLAPQQSEILFNYLGKVDGEPVKLIRHPKNHRSHVLEIDAVITDGQLLINWHYSNQLHWPETIQRLADTCAQDIEALLGTPQKEKSPSVDKKTMNKLAQLLSKADNPS